MSTDSFAEFLNKLKEIHEKEVLGLQTKLAELTAQKCRDAQRIEELFAKNHQLREQQKVLKENIKVLENRLRAGLCDRCMVTQELAKKKQDEYETSHFQSLQHIFVLTNETNRLKEENKTLKEELKRLRSLDSDRAKCQRSLSRESSSTPDSPLALLSPGSRNASTDKAASREETHHELPSQELEEEKSARRRSSPGSRISPSATVQEASVPETPSQRIANQLHGTIALVRPGSRPCPLGKTSAETATSPPARKPLLSPEREHSPSLEVYLRANKPDSHQAASSYEALKLTARKEQLCLLNQHLSLHQLGLRSKCPATDRSNSCPSPLFRAREAEGRTRAQDEWEDPAAIFELPGAVVYMRDQHLEGQLQLFKHREKLQCFLTHQRQREFRDRRPAVVPPADTCPPSPHQGTATGGKEEGSLLKHPLEGREEKHLWLNRDHLEQREKTEAARDCAMDTPLDLSEYGRGRESLKPTRWHQSPKQGEARSRGPDPQMSVLLRAGAEKSHLASGQRLPATPPPVTHESEQISAKEEEEEKDMAARLVPSSCGHPTSKSASREPELDPETRIRTSLTAQKQEPGAQPEDDEVESVKQESEKQESDEPDTTDSEVVAASEHDPHQEAPAEEEQFCTKDKAQVLQKKRKRGQDPQAKAEYKKSVRARKKVKVAQAPADAPGMTKETNNSSPASSNEEP
ncbi:RBBP8 N-terminal-like protein isoform X2 [Alligator mississippiensis]|uniref:RBBP8 N-terminal-like protein n=1 Tax=Alligator mississippiensis TaxID=8496 RepID=A0A151NYN9_ALLMI|nr:RBBP8 N-terminal-like protein isoform X2 [Alligator mississippiensis]KYO41986.1 RBBP8 N-terminal-like protein [Alligator mississippiensis]